MTAMIKQPLSHHLLRQAASNRHGLTFEPQNAKLSLSDNRHIFHVGVPGSATNPWESAAGGVSYNQELAELAAIGEGVERYVAATVPIEVVPRSKLSPETACFAEEWSLFSENQRKNSNFPFSNIYKDDSRYSLVYDFITTDPIWVPESLIVLRDDYQTGIPTSSGLAAGGTVKQALLRAIQELIERDALMVTWLHSVAAKRVRAPKKYQNQVADLSGEFWVFDLTPAYSPFPVVAVAGGIPKQGKWRYSLGVACRDTWEAALEKAFLEWNQGILFAGIYGDNVDTTYLLGPDQVKNFDEHAMYYTLFPEQWVSLPIFGDIETYSVISQRGAERSVDDSLFLARTALQRSALRLFYRDLTTIDSVTAGVRVVRAMSPDMAPIFAHQDWPMFGKVDGMLASRYPWATSTKFPNNMPHPLG